MQEIPVRRRDRLDWRSAPARPAATWANWQPDPNLASAHPVREWAPWTPDSYRGTTPLEVEPIFLAPVPRPLFDLPSSSSGSSPGLFGPRSPRSRSPPLLVPDSASPGLFGLRFPPPGACFDTDVGADDSMAFLVDNESPTMPLIPMPSAADILPGLSVNDLNMPPSRAPPAIAQRKRQHNVAFGDNQDLGEEVAQRGRPPPGGQHRMKFNLDINQAWDEFYLAMGS
ncbi:hypothetical protein B0H14DRAFT_98347 [Mycena olivaceomarginata]|nr:hypothetical protein B0H14DRAFT_98347 [Mycena olivaceomarginata]